MGQFRPVWPQIPDPLVAVCASFVVAQAATISVWLALRPADRAAHRWLLLALAAAGLTSAGDVALHLHAWSLARWLDPLAGAALLVLGPAMWLYTRALTAREPGAGGRPGAWPHFVPAAALLLLLMADAV